jgi:uncharacterized membrane protein
MNAGQVPGHKRVPSKRIEYIDLLRGWAVIVMIETHMMNATLMPSITETGLFQWVKFVNGLVAPSFLFAAGFAYAITTHRKLDDYLSFGPLLFKQVRRLLFVLALGYVLHLPKFNFSQLIHETTEHDWQVFFQVDILHCIAVSLLLLQVLLLVVRTEERLYRTLLLASVGVLLVTPVMWGVEFWGLVPVPIAAYLNGNHFSLFPLFPWSAFLFAGCITGYYYLRARQSRGVGSSIAEESQMMKRVVLWAAALTAASFPLEPLLAMIYPTYDYWRFSPSFVLLRLGLVLLLCAVMFAYEKRRGVSPRSVAALIGRESLLVYSAHLLLIYGNFGAFNFGKWVNHTYGYAHALLATGLLILLMVVFARVWDQVRRGDPRRKRVIQYGFLALALAVFFFGPGQ